MNYSLQFWWLAYLILFLRKNHQVTDMIFHNYVLMMNTEKIKWFALNISCTIQSIINYSHLNLRPLSLWYMPNYPMREKRFIHTFTHCYVRFGLKVNPIIQHWYCIQCKYGDNTALRLINYLCLLHFPLCILLLWCQGIICKLSNRMVYF